MEAGFPHFLLILPKENYKQNIHSMKYIEVDFRIKPTSEDLCDILSALLAEEADFETFTLHDNGMMAYVQKASFEIQRIDEIIAKRDDICRSSRGESNPTFYPAPEKSFSRGFTDYFIHGRQKYIDAPYSPKSMGEYLGTIEKVKNKSITIKTGKELHNGDGLCFLDRENNLLGFNVNAVAENKTRSLSQTITSNSDISMATRFKIEGSKIFRNHDNVWEKELEKSNGNRKIKISLRFTDTEDGFALSAKLYNEDSEYVTTNISIEKEIAINTEKALDNIKSKLSQWGDTEFSVEEIEVDFNDNRQQTTDNRHCPLLIAHSPQLIA